MFVRYEQSRERSTNCVGGEPHLASEKRDGQSRLGQTQPKIRSYTAEMAPFCNSIEARIDPGQER